MSIYDEEPQTLPVFCPRCGNNVVGTAIGHTFYDEPSEGAPERWTLVRCHRLHPMLVVQIHYGHGARFDDDKPWRVYPAEERALSHEIPAQLRSAHDEARACLRAPAYMATVIMCGRTIESTCKAAGVTVRGLHRKLEEMERRGLIDGRLLEWARELKVLRNEAAHADDITVTKQDAEDAIAYCEALLDYLYVLKARFDAFRQRRTQ